MSVFLGVSKCLSFLSFIVFSAEKTKLIVNFGNEEDLGGHAGEQSRVLALAKQVLYR